MDKQSRLYRKIYDFIERPWAFNLIQSIIDGGKGRQIRKFLKDVNFQSMVDIGCGTGNWAPVARGDYLGVDYSESFIEGCKKRYLNDPSKRFVQADVTTLAVSEQYDLALLISVLHHLSDSEATKLIDWVARNTRFLCVLDLYPIHWNLVSRWFYSMDRGNHIREPEAQTALVMKNPAMKLVKWGDYFCPNGLYRHTLFLFESADAQGN